MKVHTLVLAMVIGIAGSATWAADDVQGQLQAMQAQMQSQQAQLEAQSAEINRLRSVAGETWLNERRAEEIKTLVRDVLSDASTRASLLDSAVTAGHNGEHFFLASDDGNFLLNVSGQIQVRYIYNHVDDDAADRNTYSETYNDSNVEGFQIRRAKIRFDGHVVNPKLTYAIQLVNSFTSDYADREDISSHATEAAGIVYLQEAWAAYDIADGWNLKGGLFKGPFLRDELVNSSRQLAVERAYLTDYFTVGYTEGLQLSYGADQWRLAAMIHDGSQMHNSNYDSDMMDFAIAARAEVLLAGAWEQFDDYTTWSTDAQGLMLGAAIDYENAARRGFSGSFNYEEGVDLLKWTVDLSFEAPSFYGFNAFVAVVGTDVSDKSDGALPDVVTDASPIAVVAQAAAFIRPDKWDLFVRYEYIEFDGTFGIFTPDRTGSTWGGVYGDDEEDEVNILTVGTNYYFSKHQAKASFDLVWVFDPLPVSDTGAGLTATSPDDDQDGEQIALRAQFQLLF